MSVRRASGSRDLRAGVFRVGARTVRKLSPAAAHRNLHRILTNSLQVQGSTKGIISKNVDEGVSLREILTHYCDRDSRDTFSLQRTN